MAYNPTIPPPLAAVEDAQNIICDVVSFKSVGLPEYDGKYALVIDGLFSPDECTWLLQQAVESTKSTETQTGNNEVGKCSTLVDRIGRWEHSRWTNTRF